MKKLTLTILIILNLFFHCSFAQNKTDSLRTGPNRIDTVIFKNDTKVKFRRWSIGISGAPDYSYRVLKKRSDQYSSVQFYTSNDIDSMNYVEKPTYSWTLGIPITYHFKKYFSIASGIYFSNKTFQSKGFVYYETIKVAPYYIYRQENVSKQNFIFLEIPFALEYNFRPERHKKFTFSLMAGGTVCTNISTMDYNSRRLWGNPYQKNPENFYLKYHCRQANLRYLGYTIGLKATYQLSSKFIIGIEPVYKFYGKDFNRAEWKPEYAEQPYSYGINISLEFMK